jgi:recombination protein RecR
LLVEKDVDVDNIERTKKYAGLYFVIGGSVPILEKNPGHAVREKELLKAVESKSDLKEIIIAFSVTPEGENTTQYVTKLLSPLIEKRGSTISSFGRGLSTGSELEYLDADTIKSALENRH